jgi:two-component system response regulator HydG
MRTKASAFQSGAVNVVGKEAVGLDQSDANAHPMICLVDDDPSVLKATGRLLSSAGWKIEPFTDPVAFLGYAATHNPAVVVLDICMPIMDGLEVQKRLQTISPSTRVVILTSKDDPTIRARALSAGAYDFFLKPVDDEDFLAGIASAVTDVDSEEERRYSHGR